MKMNKGPGRPCLQVPYCFCSYPLWASASIHGRSSYPIGGFENSTKITPGPHTDLQTLGAFIPIIHRSLLEKPSTRFPTTPSNSPIRLSPTPESLSPRAAVTNIQLKLQLYHCEFLFTINPFLSLTHLLWQRGIPLYHRDTSHCRQSLVRQPPDHEFIAVSLLLF